MNRLYLLLIFFSFSSLVSMNPDDKRVQRRSQVVAKTVQVTGELQAVSAEYVANVQKLRALKQQTNAQAQAYLDDAWPFPCVLH